jgi:hypothetical protein
MVSDAEAVSVPDASSVIFDMGDVAFLVVGCCISCPVGVGALAGRTPLLFCVLLSHANDHDTFLCAGRGRLDARGIRQDHDGPAHRAHHGRLSSEVESVEACPYLLLTLTLVE